MRGRAAVRTAVVASVLFAWGCDASSPAPAAAPGEPLAGLTDAQRAAFHAGRATFSRAFSPEEGLGPTFNEPACVRCHDLPVAGGGGADPVRKATRFADGRCDVLAAHGGPLLQTQVTAALRGLGYGPEAVPAGATAITDIMAPPLFAAGLIEAIPDEEILKRADPHDADGDGISGRAGESAEGAVGRFGWKANFPDVRSFARGAFLDEIGLTSIGAPHEHPVGPHGVPAGSDAVADPELDEALLEQVVAYVRLLAPPAGDSADAAGRDSIRDGARVFQRTGCAACHVPTMTTGDSDVDALRGRTVALHSDLLLHDMGPENASICAPGAAPSEWRTTSLMGLRLRHRFLHDGRAQSIDAAVRAHGGEGARARERYGVLTETERAALFRYLTSL
jgi:CxxC motif-containing protein (DUF1111 family)